MTGEELLRQAERARERAYAPYSGFAVGAALLTAAGKVYLGCNIENAAFGPSVCAERTAFFKAVSEGEREFRAIAVVGGPTGQPAGWAPPCGVCRQVMKEFCGGGFAVWLRRADGACEMHTLSSLLPLGFGGETLGKKENTEEST